MADRSEGDRILSVQKGSNGDLIAEVAKLWILPNDVVVDVTYGRGTFWSKYQHPGKFVAHDLFLGDGVDLRNLPEEDASVNVVVLDPPYIPGGKRATTQIPDFWDRYGLDTGPQTPHEVRELLIAGIKECSRILAPGGRLLVKCMDYVAAGQLQMSSYDVVSTALDCGLHVADYFIHFTGKGAEGRNRDGSARVQLRSRRAHSFLYVFRNGTNIRRSSIPL